MARLSARITFTRLRNTDRMGHCHVDPPIRTGWKKYKETVLKQKYRHWIKISNLLEWMSKYLHLNQLKYLKVIFLISYFSHILLPWTNYYSICLAGWKMFNKLVGMNAKLALAMKRTLASKFSRLNSSLPLSVCFLNIWYQIFKGKYPFFPWAAKKPCHCESVVNPTFCMASPQMRHKPVHFFCVFTSCNFFNVL